VLKNTKMNASSSLIKRVVISSFARQASALSTSRFYHSLYQRGTNVKNDQHPNLNQNISPIQCNCFLIRRQKSNYTRPKNHNKTKRKKSKPKRKQPKVIPQAKPKEVPQALPLVIYQTASPHVFISACAIDEIEDDNGKNDDDNDDDSENSLLVHPKELFTLQNTPHSFQTSRFEYVSPKLFEHQLPTNPNVPEVAFLGRSNVGKSSLINAVTRSKQLAKISKSPGRTQQVNYFALVPSHLKDDGSVYRNASSPVDDDDLQHLQHGTDAGKNSPVGYLIDLPGYGFAKAPKDQVDAWQAATQTFIEERVSRGNLTRLYVLIDSRRGVNDMDKMVMGWMDEAQLNYTVVLTKGDCVGRAELVKVANEVGFRYHAQSALGRAMGNQGPFVHVVSSLKGDGVKDLMWAIDGDFKAYVAAASDTGHLL